MLQQQTDRISVLSGQALVQNYANYSQFVQRNPDGSINFVQAPYLNLAGDRALLSLSPRDNAPLAETDFDLRQWGPATNVDINPQIPPEGTDGYTYAVNGTRLSYQFTHVSRHLRTTTVEWGRKA